MTPRLFNGDQILVLGASIKISEWLMSWPVLRNSGSQTEVCRTLKNFGGLQWITEETILVSNEALGVPDNDLGV